MVGIWVFCYSSIAHQALIDSTQTKERPHCILTATLSALHLWEERFLLHKDNEAKHNSAVRELLLEQRVPRP